MSYLGRSAKLSLKAQEKVSFLATAGQTVKTGLSYTPSFIEVYVNGVSLTDTTDFTATNGNSITFTVALLLNDEVTVISLKTFTVADHYSKTEADTLLAAKATNTALATTNTAVALKAPIASPSFTGNMEVYGASTPKLTVKSGNGTSASIKLQRINENDVSTDYEIKNDGGALKIISDSTSQNEFLIQQIDSGTQRFNTNNTERMRIENSGGVLVGRLNSAWSDTQGLALNQGNSGESYVVNNGVCMYFNRGNTEGKTIRFYKSYGTEVGSISTFGASTAYTTSSDYRLKTDVQPMTGATDRVKLLKPCNFEWIADGTRVDGFLAHEAQEVVPESVVGTKDAMEDEEYEVTPATDTEEAVMGTRSVPDMQGIDQAKLVPLLTATIQELIARIEVLEGAAP